MVYCDFAENYAYVAQDAAQAFHYNNDQCTVFPVVFYYRSEIGIQNQSNILLSDSTKHDAAAVYLMQEKLIPEIKKVCPKVKKIYYISDGAKQHFKNRTQMRYLMNHKLDFGVKAEWHCNATSHGKCACDGLGACLKSEAARYSLQAKPNDAILNSSTLFIWAQSKFENIKFYYHTKQEHEKTIKKLNRLFSNPPAVPKIQTSHAFIPTTDNRLVIKRYSTAKNKNDVLTLEY